MKREIYDLCRELRPMTVRQLFYQMVSRGLIAKTEAAYKNVVCRLTGDMRKDRVLPFHWLADNTRSMRKPLTHGSMQAALDHTACTYRRALWDEQDCYVEIWLEKDALAGVLIDVTREWDVPLMVTRGYPSLSFVYTAAEIMEAQLRPVRVHYFGDRDPSGVDIPRFVEETLRERAPAADITFAVEAVTPEQIASMGLPTRPTKKSDSRAKGFEGESVEVDAIPPATLREMTESCILRHIDMETLEATRRVEAAERKSVKEMAAAAHIWAPTAAGRSRV